VIVHLDETQKKRIENRALECLGTASARLEHPFELPEIRYDLRGRAAGQFLVRDKLPRLRFNGELFARYFEENLEETVPHEIAHYIVYELFMKNRRVRVLPHGREWQAVMRLLGANPSTRHNFDMTGISVRREQRFEWHCDCRTHSIAKRTHLRMLRGQRRACVKCGSLLRFPRDLADN
jgi:SprT protein